MQITRAKASKRRDQQKRISHPKFPAVITPVSSFKLPAQEVHEGVWHAEDMSHENIVATAGLILQRMLHSREATSSSSEASLQVMVAACYSNPNIIHPRIP